MSISIHVPRVGDDGLSQAMLCGRRSFLSTSPVWGPTQSVPLLLVLDQFLSTSPVWGTTGHRRAAAYQRVHFYPRPPCGGRLVWQVSANRSPYFYPRPPCGGRRGLLASFEILGIISIHLPRVGDDWQYCSLPSPHFDFYPRPPCGGRPTRRDFRPRTGRISIHVPRVGDDA